LIARFRYMLQKMCKLIQITESSVESLPKKLPALNCPLG